MKKLCLLVCVLLAATVAASDAQTTPRRQQQQQQQQRVQWQRSESPSIKLGVRDKNTTLGRYDAKFVVTARRDGKRYEKTIPVEGDHFGIVDFPDDFAAFDYMQHGTQFDWACWVNGKVVKSGRFMLATSLELLPDERRGKSAKRKRG